MRQLLCLKRETSKSRRPVQQSNEEVLEVMPDLPKFEKDAEAKKLRSNSLGFKVEKTVGVQRSFTFPCSYLIQVCRAGMHENEGLVVGCA